VSIYIYIDSNRFYINKSQRTKTAEDKKGYLKGLFVALRFEELFRDQIELGELNLVSVVDPILKHSAWAFQSQNFSFKAAAAAAAMNIFILSAGFTDW